MKKGKTPLFCNKKAIIPIFFVSILWFLYGGKRWIRIRARASVLARIAKRPAPKQVVQAQCAARCIPRRIHDSQHKKRHRIAMSFFWWEEVDSNHRRRCQQIYSLLPLATRESSHMELVVGVEPTTC